MTLSEPDRLAPHPLKHQRLRVVTGRGEIDLAAAEQAVADLLVALGKDPVDEHLADTPSRELVSVPETGPILAIRRVRCLAAARDFSLLER